MVDSDTPLWHGLLPGMAQGMTRVMISYPFDYMRVLYQTNRSFHITLSSLCTNIYRGVGYPLAVVPIDRGIQFMIYERLRGTMGTYPSALTAAVVGSAYNVPMQYMVANRITRNRTSSKGIYRGYYPELARGIGMSTMFMGTYGAIKDIDGISPFMAGVMASLSGWAIFYPLDTIRTLQQVNEHTLSHIARHTGIRGYYRGAYLVCLRSVPSAGIGMMVYEWVKDRV